jgi:hypothetical protein
MAVTEPLCGWVVGVVALVEAVDESGMVRCRPSSSRVSVLAAGLSAKRRPATLSARLRT